MSHFRRYFEKNPALAKYIISIGKPGITVSPNPKVDASQVAKTPMVYNEQTGHWHGFRNWQKHVSTKKHLVAFDRWDANLGVRTDEYNVADIDASNPMADRLERTVKETLGLAPVKYRDNSTRRSLMYKLKDGEPPIGKWRLKWRNDDGSEDAFEWLGKGQQTVGEGIHSSGATIKWRDGHPSNPADLTEITAAQVNQLRLRLLEEIETYGYPLVAGKSAGTAAEREPLDPSRRAPSEALLDEALSYLKNNAENVPTHDDFVQHAAAIKTSGGDDYYPKFLQWAMTYEGNTEEYVEKVWSSIKDSAVGWEWLAARAHAAGFSGDAQRDFDEAPAALAGETPSPSGSTTIKASPFKWQDPKTIPPREWLYDRHMARKYVSTTVAPGGLGKSALLITESLAIVTGRNLLSVEVTRPLRVWYVNLEDPADELQRRFAAACLHYGISPEDIGGRLFVTSGRDAEIVVARDDRHAVKLAEPVIDALRQELSAKQIDVLIIDPFVASHGVPENDNGKINQVCGVWRMLAEEKGCAIELVHHVRKAAFGQSEYSVDDARGAGAMINAVRSARTLNRMSKTEADKVGIVDHWRYFRVDRGKGNNAPPPDKTTWRRHISVQLGNGEGIAHAGDSVGVVDAWGWPDPSDDVTPAQLRAVQEAVAAGVWREDAQAKHWVGKAIADALDLDLAEPSVKAKVKALQKSWVQEGVLKVVQGMGANRETKNFVEVGKRVAA